MIYKPVRYGTFASTNILASHCQDFLQLDDRRFNKLLVREIGALLHPELNRIYEFKRLRLLALELVLLYRLTEKSAREPLG